MLTQIVKRSHSDIAAQPPVERTNRQVLTIRHQPVIAGFDQWYLRASDVHFDNPHCDQKKFLRHLDEAKEKEALVFLIGDTSDCMQSKYDPRASKDDLLDSVKFDDYLDRIVDITASFLLPYDHIHTELVMAT